jgi:hypothetical protein
MTPDEAIALVQKYGKDAQVRVDGYSTWQDAACVLAGEVERLANDLKLSRGVVKDVFDDMECLPNCDSYGHEEECPDVNPMAAFRKLRQERDELRRLLLEANQIVEALVIEGRYLRQKANQLEGGE